jgi:hypothetical protein
VEKTMVDLVGKRTRVAGASLDGESVQEIDRPSRIAARLIQSVASLVTEIGKRSPSPRELVLKFEDPGRPGHRDEVFVAREELLGKWKGLTVVRRNLFDSWGLGKAMSREVESEAMDAIVEMAIEEASSGGQRIPSEVPTSVANRRS